MSADNDLLPAEAARLRLKIATAALLARIGPDAELEILRRLAAGDRQGAERIRRAALTRSMQAELAALLDGSVTLTRQ